MFGKLGRNGAARSADERQPQTVERLFTEGEKVLLAGLTLRDTCFDHVDFRNADLSYATFERVSLVGCDLRGAKLTSATFRDCDLRNARLDHGTLLRNSSFEGTSLFGAVGLTRSARNHVLRNGGTFLASV